MRRQTALREAPVRHVFDRQEDDARHVRSMRDEPGIQQHDLPSDARKNVIDVDVVQLAFSEKSVAQERSKRRNVPLAIAQVEQHFTDRVFGGDTKGSKERAVGPRHAKLRVENEERLVDRINDVEQ